MYRFYRYYIVRMRTLSLNFVCPIGDRGSGEADICDDIELLFLRGGMEYSFG